MRNEETDLSFAEFDDPKRPYTAPRKESEPKEAANSLKEMVTRGAIRTRDPQLRRSTRETLESTTNSVSYKTFQVQLVAAGDRLSRLEGGERCALPSFPTDVGTYR
jgi:hypothetical protein